MICSVGRAVPGIQAVVETDAWREQPEEIGIAVTGNYIGC